MSNNANLKQYVNGLRIIPTTSSGIVAEGEMEVFSNSLRVYVQGAVRNVTTNDQTQTLTNKTLTGNTAVNLVSGSGTFVLNTSGTITNPNGTDTLAGISLSQTLTNKTMSGSANTFSNIPYSSLILTDSIVNADINSAAAIAYSKLNLSNSIVNADINSSAAIALSKLAALSTNKVAVTNGSGILAASSAIAVDSTTGAPTITVSSATPGSNGVLSAFTNTSTSGTQSGLKITVSDGATGTQVPVGLNVTVTESGSSGLVLGASIAASVTGAAVGGIGVNITSTGAGTISTNYYGLQVTKSSATVSGDNYAINMPSGTIRGTDFTASLPIVTDSNKALVSQSYTTFTSNLSTLVGDSGSGGTKGLVPAPASGDAAANKFLKADGTWTVVSDTGITQLTGDVTAGPGSGSQAATIAAQAVTNSKLANVATATFKGRTTSGTGSPEDLTATQATALLNTFVGDSGSGGTKGLVTAPTTGDATKFLRGDGTWAIPTDTGITSLNTLVATTQTFAVGTGGSDFNISSATSTHTFNIPDAGASARGLVTTSTQTFAGDKTIAASTSSSGTSALATTLATTSTSGIQSGVKTTVTDSATGTQVPVAINASVSVSGTSGNAIGASITTTITGTAATVIGANIVQPSAGNMTNYYGLQVRKSTGTVSSENYAINIPSGTIKATDFTASVPLVTDASKAIVSQSYATFTSNLSTMVGDSGSGGTKGLVPAPSTGDATKVLSGAGTWVTNGAGSVTSVGLAVPASSLFSVSGSPVTGSGTLTIATAGTSGGVPYFDSTSTLNSSALLTNHAIVLGGGAGAAPKVLASLGTTSTVLHGNASGDPTFGAVALATDVSGTLQAAQFPALTGDVTTSAGALATTIANLAVTNAKIANSTIDLTAKVTGALPIANGGTGQTTANPAFNALSPLTTKGDLVSYSTVNARLAAGSNNQVLKADSTQTVGLLWANALSGVATPTTTYSAALTDDIIYGNTASGAFTVTLPSASTTTGHPFFIKNGGVNPLTVSCADGIDGGTTYILSTIYKSAIFVSFGSAYLVF